MKLIFFFGHYISGDCSKSLPHCPFFSKSTFYKLTPVENEELGLPIINFNDHRHALPLEKLQNYSFSAKKVFSTKNIIEGPRHSQQVLQHDVYSLVGLVNLAHILYCVSSIVLQCLGLIFSKTARQILTKLFFRKLKLSTFQNDMACLVVKIDKGEP